MKFLFILKDRVYNKEYATSYGLLNSANQVSEFLNTQGHHSEVVSVFDGNAIDKEVHRFKPDVVVIEALWVPTLKLKELIELKKYRNITWIVRIHSDIGFLSAETQALKYTNEYLKLKKPNLIVAPNNYDLFHNLLPIYNDHALTYLPNIITVNDEITYEHKPEKNHIDVGCFGALRILKNQVYQAVCAINMADKLNKRLHFHINFDVAKSSESSVYKNLVELFDATHGRHKLIVHNWLNKEDFAELIQKLDLGMQISYTESFNIVTADFINNGTLIAISKAIAWPPDYNKTSTINYKKTIRRLTILYRFRNSKILKWINKLYLKIYNKKAKKTWLNFIDFLNSLS